MSSNDPLYDLLKESGKVATPEELARRGVRRVRSLGAQDLERLVRQAVNRTLVDSTVGVAPAEIDELVERAHGELRRLLAARRELDETRAQIRGVPQSLREELAALREEQGESGSDVQNHRIDLLERRLAKVIRALEETEVALEETARRIDRGIASAYRETQGLSADDPRASTKLTMLRGVYDENRRLAEGE